MQQQKNPGEHIAHEENRSLTRKKVTLASGIVYTVGMVLGQNSTTKLFHQLAPSATDGTQVAAAINYAKVDASSDDMDGTVTRGLTAVTDEDLEWPASLTTEQKSKSITELESRHIIVD
jgi:hypothetical protein